MAGRGKLRIMAVEEQEIPYHVMAISGLAKNTAPRLSELKSATERSSPSSLPRTIVLTSSAHATAYCAT